MSDIEGVPMAIAEALKIPVCPVSRGCFAPGGSCRRALAQQSRWVTSSRGRPHQSRLDCDQARSTCRTSEAGAHSRLVMEVRITWNMRACAGSPFRGELSLMLEIRARREVCPKELASDSGRAEGGERQLSAVAVCGAGVRRR